MQMNGIIGPMPFINHGHAVTELDQAIGLGFRNVLDRCPATGNAWL
jgi:hypothetical protein